MRCLWLHIAGVLIAASVLGSLWYPVYRHYRVSPPAVSLETVDSLRTVPSDGVLEELSRFNFLLPQPRSDSELLALAEQLVEGRLRFRGFLRMDFDPRFAAQDLERGDSATTLFVASLGIPALLTDAFQIGGDDRFLRAAASYLRSFARFDAAAWRPTGPQWNDHAIAARSAVLADFWRSYRAHPSYQRETAETILRLVQRSAAFLSKPGHFTYATNHGVMQNLALLHIAIGFPNLPDASRLAALAVQRLESQLAHYVSPEGIVLEHSFGYHLAGVEFLAVAVRYLQLAGLPVHPEWQRLRDRAAAFKDLITRPDGSIALIGDTRSKAGEHMPQRTAAMDAHGIFPISGYAVWSRQAASGSHSAHMSVTWSNFPGHGHKHADELSFALWADGESWITSVGYWPYTDPRRASAIGWRGSNAPHLEAEPFASQRVAAVRAKGITSGTFALDLERRTESGFAVRRQIVDLGSRVWLVMDSYEGESGSSGEVVFNFSSRVKLAATDNDSCYELAGAVSRRVMQVCFMGPPGLAVVPVEGEVDPFGGWEADADREIRPAAALRVTHPAAVAWMASTWSLSESGSALASPRVEWNDASSWRVEVPVANHPLSVLRRDDTVTVRGGLTDRGLDDTLELTTSPRPIAERRAIRDALERSATRYPRVRNTLEPYRARAFVLLGLGLIAQELVLLVVGRLSSSRWVCALRAAAIVAWLVGALWLHQVYFSL